MSLKSRLLKNRELKALSSVQDCSDIDLTAYFKENSSIDKLYVYAYNKIFVEKNGNTIKAPINFTTEEAYLNEINRIIQVNSGDLKDKKIVFNRKNEIITILLPPIVKNVPYLSIERKKDISYSDYFDEKLISSEIAAYFKEALSRKANIFIVGNADLEKSLIMNFIIDLSDENNKNIIYDNLGKVFVKRLCSINFSQNELENIKYTDYDNIFCFDVKAKDLTAIFSLITSGYNGFVVDLSLKNDVDIFAALRNLILLDNVNLFEENADFLTSTAIDIVVFAEKNDKEKVCISKISEVSKNKQNTVLKDIFVLNSVGIHISTGNTSKFYNQENTNSYLKEYLEDEHVHSYISGITEKKKQEFVTDTEKTAIENKSEHKSKKQKLKEKLKRLKKETSQPLENNEKAQNNNDFKEEKNVVKNIQNILAQDEEALSVNYSQNSNEGLLSQEDDFAKEDIIDNTLYNNSKIRNIFDESSEEETKSEEIQINEQKDIQPDISQKYIETNENQIKEEPELFSEITEEDVNAAEDNYLDIDDENI